MTKKLQSIETWLNLALGVFFIALAFLGVKYFFFSGFFGGNKAQIELDWQSLGELDYITGAMPENLSSLNNQYLKIPGFMVPLEDDQKKVTQFLLVPNPQACIHVPPPPPNQMVLVDMKEGTEVVFGPIWVHGTLNIKSKSTQYGEVSYSLKGEWIEAYQ